MPRGYRRVSSQESELIEELAENFSDNVFRTMMQIQTGPPSLKQGQFDIGFAERMSSARLETLIEGRGLISPEEIERLNYIAKYQEQLNEVYERNPNAVTTPRALRDFITFSNSVRGSYKQRVIRALYTMDYEPDEVESAPYLGE